MAGLSHLIYGAARAQDIVGLDVRFTYGWSCVIGWIATVIAFLNAIITLVLGCVYLDHLTERMVRVREEMGLDNISIQSETLRRINAMDEDTTGERTLSEGTPGEITEVADQQNNSSIDVNTNVNTNTSQSLSVDRDSS